MYYGVRCSFLSSLLGADVYGEVPGSGAEFGSSVDFSIGYTGSWVVSQNKGFLGEFLWPSSLLLESYMCIRGCMTLSSSL